MTDQRSSSKHSADFEPLQNWIAPGETREQNQGLIIGGNPTTGPYALVYFSAAKTQPLAIFSDRDDAVATVSLINSLTTSPASSRIGGAHVREAETSQAPGVQYLGFTLTTNEENKPVPDTTKPVARMWVLPHRQMEAIALMEVDGPNGHRALCRFLDDEAANLFVSTMDAIFASISDRVA